MMKEKKDKQSTSRSSIYIIYSIYIIDFGLNIDFWANILPSIHELQANVKTFRS
jgi:hypothetical protein